MNNYREAFLIEQIYATLFSITNKLQVQGDKYFDKLTFLQIYLEVLQRKKWKYCGSY